MEVSEPNAKESDTSSHASRELLRNSSEASNTTSGSSSGPVTERTQLLRLETIRDHESRVRSHVALGKASHYSLVEFQQFIHLQRVVMSMKAATVLGIVGAVALGVIKETRGRDLIVMNRSYVIGQTACFVVMLAVLVGVFSAWAWRIVDSHRRGMYWSARRKKAIHVRSIAKCCCSRVICPCTSTSG